jgi:hypothetical protein
MKNVASPFTRRNERIRDSLNTLSKTLELPNLNNGKKKNLKNVQSSNLKYSEIGQSLEDRLNLIKGLK